MSHNNSSPPSELITPQTPQHKIEEVLRQIHEKLAKAGTHIKTIDYAHTAVNVKKYMQAHPYQAAFHISSLVLLAAPGLLAAPALGIAGFGGGGVVAGSAAAAHQAAVGPIAAKSAFAVLQSAGAGG
ncbi:MAG: hypothetical protein Q9170_006717, partial [Blastenia crenularia]